MGSVRSRLSRTTAPLQKLSSVYQQCLHLGAPPAWPMPTPALPPARVRLPQARPPGTHTPLKAGQRHRVWGWGNTAPSSAAEKWARPGPQPLLERNLTPEKCTSCLKGKQHSGKAATATHLGEAGIKALMLLIQTPF